MESLPSAYRASEDAEQLKLLGVFHYVFAGLLTVGGFVVGAYFAFVGYMVTELMRRRLRRRGRRRPWDGFSEPSVRS